MRMETQKTHIYSIDALRTVSILAVLLIHTTSQVLEAVNYRLGNVPLTLFFNQISRFAVPLFFMISGFVLELNHNVNENIIEYLKKRFGRIFVPYLFWSLLYYFLVFKVHSVNFFQALLAGNASYQLYFIPSLLILYLLFPLLHKFWKIIGNRWIMGILGLGQILLLYHVYFVRNLTWPYPISVALFNFYIFILGMAASHYKEKLIEILDKLKYWLIPMVTFLGYFVFQEGRSQYFKTFNIDAIYDQWRPSVLFYTIFLGALLYYLFTKINFSNSIITKLSKLSFFVFLFHVIILETFWENWGKYILNRPYFGILFFVLVATLSYLVAFLVHKIPYLSKVTG